MRLRILSAAAAALALAGCTALQGGARIDPLLVQEGTPAFEGLIESGAPSGTSAPRYIFMVHGMGDTSPDYSQSLFSRLGDQGYRRTGGHDWVLTTLPRPMTVEGEAFICDGVSGPPCRFTSFGRYRTDEFAKGDERVVVYTYYWHEDLHSIQGPFMAADLEVDRSLLMRGLKRNIVVMGFGDAAAYLGPASKLVQEGLSVGLCAMLRQAAGRPVAANSGAVACDIEALTPVDAAAFGQAEYGFVTMSLGSRMLFDTLELNAARSANVLPILSRRTRNIYMLANQLPLLGLGQLTVRTETGSHEADSGIEMPSTGPSGCAQAEGLFSRMACERSRPADPLADTLSPAPVSAELNVVAFHDPEDLLGFGAGKGMARPRPGLRFIEVWNRNAPVYLGLAPNPTKTHASELEHDSSARLILCGAVADRNGRLEPQRCL